MRFDDNISNRFRHCEKQITLLHFIPNTSGISVLVPVWCPWDKNISVLALGDKLSIDEWTHAWKPESILQNQRVCGKLLRRIFCSRSNLRATRMRKAPRMATLATQGNCPCIWCFGFSLLFASVWRIFHPYLSLGNFDQRYGFNGLVSNKIDTSVAIYPKQLFVIKKYFSLAIVAK